MPIKAILEDRWYLCGCCGHKLAKRIYGHLCTVGDAEPSEHSVDTLRTQKGANASLEIKCKHKSSGKKCDTVNVIEI